MSDVLHHARTTPTQLEAINHAHIPTPWTDQQLERLRVLWAEGKSGRDVAGLLNTEFGTVYSRSAVIGKVYRQGLPLRQVENRGKWVRDHTVRGSNRPGAQLPPTPEVDDQVIPFAQRRTLLDLRPQDCRWPVGDPCEPGFFFCGGKSLETSPYCAGHSKRAYGYVKSEKAFGAFRY